jgi:hypothetical protein
MFEGVVQRRSRSPWWAALAIIPVVAIVVVAIVRGHKSEPAHESPAPMVIDPVPVTPPPDPNAVARLELPGMSLETPGTAPVKGSYGEGSALHEGGAIEWGVTWQMGEQPDDAGLRTIVRSMTQVLARRDGVPCAINEDHAVDVGGAPGRTFELLRAGGRMYMTFARCGDRVVQLLTSGPLAKEHHDRMISSFRCTPDPKQLVKVTTAAITPRPGWKEHKPGQWVKGPVMVIVNRLPNPSKQPLRDLLVAGTSTQGFAMRGEPTLRGSYLVWGGTLRLERTEYQAALVAWSCPDDTAGLAYVAAVGQGGAIDEGIELAMTGQCR